MAWLVRGNVPCPELNLTDFDPEEMLAWSIALGECEGGEWDWNRMKWREPDAKR